MVKKIVDEKIYNVEMYPKIFGAMVSYIRTDKGINRKKLASDANISHQYLGFIERGQKCPSIITAIKLANALNTPIEKFFIKGKNKEEITQNL